VQLIENILFMRKAVFLLFLFFGNQILLSAQNEPVKGAIEKKRYDTKALGETSIKLDGVLNDAAWDAVAWSGDFIQYRPAENTPPAQQTRFKILYDHKYLYIAAQCLDSMPSEIVKRMARRDDFPGDWIEVNIDSYHDLRTAFSFTVSASGVRSDEFVSNNGDNWDVNWNPIWYARTHINDEGWAAEIKIPLSQLRYGNEAEKVWGIQFSRFIFRKEERSTWQYIPQSAGAWVSNFGELHGLNGIPAQKQVEIAPYFLAETSKYKREQGNPFATGADSKISGGVDGKVAVTSDLILDFTVNPDFGQVEADPSKVRIDGFQNFFEERRPFFIESRNIFDYQLTNSVASGSYNEDILFYSRRIGGAPHKHPVLHEEEYMDAPDKTSILGAAKFSGKTKNGWSIGVLDCVTEREKAVIDLNSEQHSEVIEPLSNYFVGRLQKDINGGNTVLGGIVTAVNRENDLDKLVHKSAYSGGLDFLHYWKTRTWYYRGNFITSHVAGSPETIYQTQTSFEHLFQRTNITEARLDSTRTSLTGTSGAFRIGKGGGREGKWGQVFKFETGLTWRSPQLELNDMGFMRTANEVNHFTWCGFVFQKPISIFRSGKLNYNHWARWDFSGQLLFVNFDVSAHAVFKNYWQLGSGVTWNPYDVSNTALRGGSSLRKPAGMGWYRYINSDTRKKVTGRFEMTKEWAAKGRVLYDDYILTLTAQPLNALNLNLSTGYTKFSKKQDQYVTQVAYGNLSRIIVSEVKQQTMSMTLRLSYNITPDLTVQYYGQSFVTRPVYGHFGYVTDPLNPSFDDRFHRFDANEIRYEENKCIVDENQDGQADYSFQRPDFTFMQFRSNLVIRWEYRPGSELYLVWSQGTIPDGSNDLNTSLDRLLLDEPFGNRIKNTALVKLTYRFLK